MNFGFRYHVASLVAVFFSLILGILIGGALFPDHILVDEQAVIITELEERFRQTQASLVSAQDELKLADLAWEQLLDTMSPDMLATKTAIVVDVENELIAPLHTILEWAGAEVLEVKEPHLDEIQPAPDSFVVIPLTSDPILPEVKAVMDELASKGIHLAFVWNRISEPAIGELPQSLKVDSIDTSLGKLAFLLGIARGSQGHYGWQKGAQGLFP